MGLPIATRQRANADYNGFNIYNLGAIPDLFAYLTNLAGTVSKGTVYGYVYGDAYNGNIAVLPWRENNVYKDTQFSNGLPIATPYGNHLGAIFNYNYVESDFTQNTIGDNVQSNVFRQSFSQNAIGISFQLNVFGIGCKRNKFGNFVSTLRKNGVFATYPNRDAGPAGFCDNLVGNSVTDIWLGDNITYCTIGDNCTKIQLGDNCKNVTLLNCHANADGSRFVIPAGTTNVTYNNNQIDLDPYGVAGKLGKVANLSDLQDKLAARFNLGLTGQDDKILPVLLPSYVDDVVEYDTVAQLPATGERGKIYVITTGADIDKQYRWSGTGYRQITASPGSTDSITEGALNLFFTENRAITAKLGGYLLATVVRTITANDSVVLAIGILEKGVKDNATALQTLNKYVPSTASETNKLATMQDLAVASGGPLVTPFANQLMVTIQHNRNRLVMVQIYENDGIQSDALVQQLDLNNVQISFGGTVGLSGNIILF